MALSSGSQSQILRAVESVYGTAPDVSSTHSKRVRYNTHSLELAKATLDSGELRTDRSFADVRSGRSSVTGDINSELSYGSFDTELEALLGGSWATKSAAAVGPHSDVTVATTGDTYTSAALFDFVADGIQPNDYVNWTGFAQPGNNGEHRVKTVAQRVLTVYENLTDEASGAAVQYTKPTKILKVGTTKRSFALEAGYTDINQYLLFLGCVFNRGVISIRPDAMVTLALSVIGSGMERDVTSFDADPDDAETTSVFSSFVGEIKEGGTAMASLLGFDLTLDNGAVPDRPILTNATSDFFWGRSNITGTVSAYFKDGALLDKFINESASSLQVSLWGAPPDDNKIMRIVLPKIRYLRGSAPVRNEQGVTIDLPFRAIYDSTLATQMAIEINNPA